MFSGMESTGRQLRLRVRDNVPRRRPPRRGDSNNNGNLFVRLSPGLAKDLCRRALRGHHDENHVVPSSSAAWNMATTLDSDELHFLPLKITIRGRGDKDDNADTVHTIFASFNGGIIESNGQNSGTFL